MKKNRRAGKGCFEVLHSFETWKRIVPVLCLLFFLSCAQSRHGTDLEWFSENDPAEDRAPRYRGTTCSSQYLVMRDGVLIAVDVYLPRGLGEGEKIPAILHQTRYFRSMELRRPLRWFLGGKPYDHTTLYAKRRKTFVERGYAWVDVDVRGSGASYGSRICPWSPDEIRDGAEIVDWIVEQPWSNGMVGAMGISYDGTTAEMLLVNRHPAVRAVAPRFSLFDTYVDVAFPGGIHDVWFTENWRRLNDALDKNAPAEIKGWWVDLFVTGVQPVDSDRDRSLRQGAVRAHEDNYDVHAGALSVACRDDISDADPLINNPKIKELLAGDPIDPEGSIGLFSPHNYAREIEDSGAAIYSYSGWLDGAYPHSAIKRFLTIRTPGSRLILGPWNHGGGWNINQLSGPTPSSFDHEAELLRFFDAHLKGIDTGIRDKPPVHYYTMVEEKWKTADTWPPPGLENASYYLNTDNRLTRAEPSGRKGSDAYRVDPAAATGSQSRWRNQIAVDAPVRYADRREQDRKLLVYTSAPLEDDMEVTGHPVVTLFVSSTAEDGNFIAYLEDVSPDGRVSYVTEGQLRAIHRRLSDREPPYVQTVPYRTFKRRDALPLVPGETAEIVFDLLPTSYLFQKGHSIRLALSGADASHFNPLTDEPPDLRFHRNQAFLSRIDLPRAVR